MISTVMEDYCLLYSKIAFTKLLPSDYANVAEELETALPGECNAFFIRVYGHFSEDLTLFIAL